MKLFSTKKSSIISYCVFNVLLIGLSLLLLFINVYELSMVLGISFIFNGLYLVLIMFYGADSNVLQEGKGMAIFGILRYLIEIINLVICGLLIYFLKPLCLTEGFTKLRFIFVLASLISYFVALAIFYFNAKEGEKKC